MSEGFDNPDAMWRQCENAWHAWLQQAGRAVTRLGLAVGNHPRTDAPMISVGARACRAPDLMTTQGGHSTYWEVKFRTRAEVDPLTGAREHWMAYDVFQDYVEVAQGTGSSVFVVLYEAATSTAPGRWLQCDTATLLERGRECERRGRGGELVTAWTWLASDMEVVPGPRVDAPPLLVPILADEGTAPPLRLEDLQPVERRLRKSRGVVVQPPREVGDEATMGEATLRDDPMTGLDVLRRSLGIPHLPRYSVLRVSSDEQDVSELLGLLEYGIRVFLISGPGCTQQLPDLDAYRQARLLEWAVLDHEPAETAWVVDGQFPEPRPAALAAMLAEADATGEMNVGQYEIVHAPHDRDVLVTAGAGTGKTETMAERLVFLLSTVGGGGEDGSEPDLRTDEVSLVTFTRDAAKEMRARLSRTLILRRRLCRQSVQPLAWLLQLSASEIATIHTFARRLVQEGGAPQGLSPAFTVEKQTMAFRALVYEALSQHLTELLAKYDAHEVPAAHTWLEHITQVWEGLANNGVDMMSLGDPSLGGPELVNWGSSASGDLNSAIADITRAVLLDVAAEFRTRCLAEDAINTSQLVPAALTALQGDGAKAMRRPRYLFVDEFQDTDPVQMSLLIGVAQHLGASLFVVGDAKQGIYRFRGAEGNAFDQLRARVVAAGRPELVEFPLTRNFRSGARLLASLHPLFSAWGAADLLPYGLDDELRPARPAEDTSAAVTFERVNRRAFVTKAAQQVKQWREDRPDASIAVLCRRNTQAIAVQGELIAQGVPCELRIGGSFFTTEAVRDLRSLLEGVLDPTDDAALLEIMETRWAAGLLAGRRPPSTHPNDLEIWSSALDSPSSWDSRLRSVAGDGSFPRHDLTQIRQRLLSLREGTGRMPLMAWVVECFSTFEPEGCERSNVTDDHAERRRYARCFDHLLTIMDSTFADSPVTLHALLAWLRLQIATNRTEDEPFDEEPGQGTTTALTVHKAKGLEYDMVLVPSTWTEFGPPGSVRTRIAVLRNDDEPPRLAWEWKDARTFTNVGPSEAELWRADDDETAKEETRLLYVALTRARDELKAYLASNSATGRTTPNSWAALLENGGATT